MAYVYMCVGMQRPEEDIECPLHHSPPRILLKHGLSLNLELGLWAATPSDLLVSASHSPRVARVRETTLSFFMWMLGI